MLGRLKLESDEESDGRKRRAGALRENDQQVEQGSGTSNTSSPLPSLVGQPAAEVEACVVRMSAANLEGECACRPAHASATCAHPRDQKHELRTPCPLAQAVGRACARRLATFILSVAPCAPLNP